MDMPLIASQLSQLGFDFLFIDLEHGQVSDSTIATILLSKKENCKVFIRISAIEEAHIKHALDLGCDGIIAPRVEKMDEVKTLLDYAHYPPKGKRGLGFVLANQYGLKFEEYATNFTPVILPQIESVEGLALAEIIANTVGVSGLFVGPYDLSLSMGIPGQFNSSAFQEAYTHIRHACTNAKKSFCTFASTNDTITKEIEHGTHMITIGADANLILKMYQQLLEPFRL